MILYVYITKDGATKPSRKIISILALIEARIDISHHIRFVCSAISLLMLLVDTAIVTKIHTGTRCKKIVRSPKHLTD